MELLALGQTYRILVPNGLRCHKMRFQLPQTFRNASAKLPQSFRKEIMNKKCGVAYAFLFAHDMFDKYVQCKMPEKA